MLLTWFFTVPTSPPPGEELLRWSDKDPAWTQALLPKYGMDIPEIHVWKKPCERAIDCLTNNVILPPPFDWKGHIVHLSVVEPYSYCIRCMVSRKAKDSKFIAHQPCTGEVHEHAWPEGTWMRKRQHLVCAGWRVWKRAGRRYGLRCVKCRKEEWATNARAYLYACV